MNNEEGNQKEFVTVQGKEYEVFKEIKKKRYSIKFVKQENLNKNIDEYIRIVAQLLYEDALSS